MHEAFLRFLRVGASWIATDVVPAATSLKVDGFDVLVKIW